MEYNKLTAEQKEAIKQANVNKEKAALLGEKINKELCDDLNLPKDYC